MAASISTGINWVNGDVVHAQRLHDSIEDAVITGIDRSNRLAAEPAHFVHVGAAMQPSPAALEPWYNVNSGTVVSRDAGGVDMMAVWPNCQKVTLAASSATALAGMVLGFSSYAAPDMTMKVTEQSQLWNAFGVAAHDFNPGAEGVAVLTGLCRVKMKAGETASAGQKLIVSDEDGLAEAVALGSGVGPLTFGGAFRATNSGYTWTLLRK